MVGSEAYVQVHARSCGAATGSCPASPALTFSSPKLQLYSSGHSLGHARSFSNLHTGATFCPAVPLRLAGRNKGCSQLALHVSPSCICVLQEGFVAEDDLGARDDYTREVDEEAAFKQAQVSLGARPVSCMAPVA